MGEKRTRSRWGYDASNTNMSAVPFLLYCARLRKRVLFSPHYNYAGSANVMAEGANVCRLVTVWFG
jgi:hypothetical protein